MQITRVQTRIDSNKFVQFPIGLYKDVKEWIRPIDKEIAAVFDTEKNKSYQHGACERWIVEDQGRVLGRIAAFYLNKSDKGIEGGVGFFESINDQSVANLLFDTSKEWLTQHGATYMDGPVNFGPRDKWWGLLTKGFELEPNYQCNYNFAYYRELFENYGFKVYFEHYTFVRVIADPVHPRLLYKAGLIANNPDYTVEHFRLREFDKFASDIIEVYNKAWVNHEGVTTISQEQGKAIMKRLKPIIQQELVWMAYYKGEPAGIFVNIPEVNQILKYVNGKFNLLGKLKFLWYKNRLKNRKLLGLIFGVTPDHQGKGVDGAVIVALANEASQNFPQFKTIEMQGIGDFNRKMLLVVKQVGGDVRKVHTTFRYLFDRDQPFERMKSMR